MSGPGNKLSFWGVRGSTPTVDPADLALWWKTRPCLELTAPDGTQFILDCGTGLRVLGQPLDRSRRRSDCFRCAQSGDTYSRHSLSLGPHSRSAILRAAVFGEQCVSFYSFRSKHLGRDSLKQVFETQMATPYFPVNMSAMTAKKKFWKSAAVTPSPSVENKITARYINHPQGCLAIASKLPASPWYTPQTTNPAIRNSTTNCASSRLCGHFRQRRAIHSGGSWPPRVKAGAILPGAKA